MCRRNFISGLVFWVFLSFSGAFGQVTIPDPHDGRVGSQLLFYFDMVHYDAGYLTITNTGASSVPVHFQLFSSAGGGESIEGQSASGRTRAAVASQALSASRAHLGASCSVVYDLRRFALPNGQALDLGGIEGFLSVTPVIASPGNPAIAYNHLAGSSVHVHLERRNSFGLDAVARLAVDAAGNPLADSTVALDGVNRRFQNIQPSRLYDDSFFALDQLTDSRIILLTFTDNYSPSAYLVGCGAVELRGIAVTNDCGRVLMPDLSFSCVQNVPLQTALGGNVNLFRQSGGFLELTPSNQPFQNIVGIASQTLATFTVNKYMWGK